jgi:CSLREA domain-containing protein
MVSPAPVGSTELDPRIGGGGGKSRVEVCSVRRLIVVLVSATALVSFLPGTSEAALTFTVNSTGDGGDANLSDSMCRDHAGKCTLRAAIEQSNWTADEREFIHFAIRSSIRTISPRRPLPPLTDVVIIDGRTQPGYSGRPIVELNGEKAGDGVNGLALTDETISVHGLVINRFSGNGIYIEGPAYADIRGNYIGTDVSGTAARPNGTGIRIDGTDNFITDNVISGNLDFGLWTSGAFNEIRNNYMGTDATGAGLIGNGVGVATQGIWNNIFDNIIAGNEVGVIVGNGTGHAIRSNSIHSNTGLGIDLAGDGVTPNDPGDGDSGANNLQNFPVLTSATSSGGSITIRGTLNSTPEPDFSVQFFANAACDAPSGHGEGERLLGTADVVTDGNGNATFTASFSTAVPPGHVITATASAYGEETSEFSACRVVRRSSVS